MKIVIGVLIIILSLTLPNIVYAIAIYNNDTKPRDVQVTNIRSGSQDNLTVYNNATTFIRCRYGCEIRVMETGSTITLESESSYSSKTVVIDAGRLRVR